MPANRITLRSLLRVLLMFGLPALLAACGSLPEGLWPAPSPTINLDAVATSVVGRFYTQTALAERLPPLTIATDTPIPAASATPLPAAPANCVYWPADLVDQPLPEPASLKWMMQQGGSGRWMSLEGFSSPVLQAEPAPGGRWWAVRVLRKALAAGPWETALYILDSAGDQHWQASLQGHVDQNQFAWLADGSLLWVDQQRLWLAPSDGGERRDLNAPEAVNEVWHGAQDQVLVSGAGGLWRVEVTSGTWLPVSELAPLAGLLGAPAFSGPGSNLSVSPGGQYAVLMAASSPQANTAQIWLIPFDAAEPARLAREVSYVGYGGRIPAPLLLGNGQYIVPGQPVGEPGVFDAFERALLPINGEARIPLSRLLPEGQSLLAIQASPDGQWLALVHVPAGVDPADASWSVEWVDMVALEPLYTLPGDAVLSWRSLPAAAWVVEYTPNGQLVRQADLPVGTELRLAETPLEALPAVVPTEGGLYLFTSNMLLTFDQDGRAGETYSLPVSFLSIDQHQASITGQVFLTGVNAVDQQGQCSFRFPVILWSPGMP